MKAPVASTSNDSRFDRICDRLFAKKHRKGAVLALMLVLVSVAIAGTITMYLHNSRLWMETAVTCWLIVFVPLGYTIEDLSSHRHAKCVVGFLNMIGILGAAVLQIFSILNEAGVI